MSMSLFSYSFEEWIQAEEFEYENGQRLELRRYSIRTCDWEIAV